MKKFNKEMLIEIIGAIILLALIGGIVTCNYNSCQSKEHSIWEENYALSR